MKDVMRSYLDQTPDFVKLAEAYGAAGLRIQTVSDVDDGIREAVAIDKPVFVEVPVDQFENCYPMIPAGGCNHEMILEDPPELQKRQPVEAMGQRDGKDTILTA